jgi:hypothetical protein
VPNLVIFPLFLVTTIFLVVIAVQLRSSRSRRTSPIRHKVRITSSGGTQQVVVIPSVRVSKPAEAALERRT